MLIIENQEHFDKVREFARSVGADAELQKRLDFLAGFGGDPRQCQPEEGYPEARRDAPPGGCPRGRHRRGAFRQLDGLHGIEETARA